MEDMIDMSFLVLELNLQEKICLITQVYSLRRSRHDESLEPKVLRSLC